MPDLPIEHRHVKVQRKRRDQNDNWFAYFMEPDGESYWMSQPVEPIVGEEQTLYVLRKGTKIWKEFEELTNRGGTLDEMNKFIRRVAQEYGEWCERTWDEAREEFLRLNRPN